MSLTPADAAAAYVLPDLTVIPLGDVAPAQVVLVNRAGDFRQLTAAFRAAVKSHMSRHPTTDGNNDRP
ncbi:hypothetical protein [Streptomyces sp.]|uniref:hypothetical protein n=1 Tax=Streptomyces sp. TaxID=1931 RepID=UPI002D772FD0|nr:hypothetical protein [Streptomyces sp.]HET6359915.1 hypothetical protein [Streptomyces sp.]